MAYINKSGIHAMVKTVKAYPSGTLRTTVTGTADHVGMC